MTIMISATNEEEKLLPPVLLTGVTKENLREKFKKAGEELELSAKEQEEE